ncbi:MULTISPECIES: S8 family peptidase [Bacillales]|jgi:subtilisin family serine protease|uniref:Peptidase S8 n=2 Tax=Brevibacillus TaxID=55080 RepID=A0AA48RJ20_9BACL|nr:MULTISPECIES: S8 family peptidase [Bacillales]REK65529.1 MAG: peptidase S8 [Brevibacillus sp.]MBR8660788.1 S8 family peptidase [Brevibacillus sp. NL20B1]MDT3417226.1 subtilisin [Brevibacillus aydinogluensis]NNV03207.1 peptidase S8 [Brevibacillus sp. MCWH]UFJ62524.1 S8 family peptidase [Anoxybacillus sediminis]
MRRQRKKLLGGMVLSAALVLSAFSGGAGAVDESTNTSSSSDKLRVLIQPDKSVRSLKASLKRQLGERHDFDDLGFTTEVTEEELKKLTSDKSLKVTLVNTLSIAEFQEEGRVEAMATPSDRTPWGIEAIYRNSSIQSTSGGKGIRVAVLDTGAYTAHPDLSANVEQCYNFTTSSPVVNGCADGNGHGTHVAGTILANGGGGSGIYGVAPEAKLWAYKVLSDGGSGYADDIAYAIRYAADQGVSKGVKVVISMSLGSSAKDSLIANAVTYAQQRGALVVAAAGNSGPSANTIGYPGGLKDAVAVAALENVQQNGTYRVADFSSRGNPSTAGDYVIQERDVEVSAPGRSVESTWPNGGYNTISGTSMATPHISGLAAKIWASNPTWSNNDVRAELQKRAKANDIKGGISAGTGDDIASGFGFPTVQAGDQ